MSLPQLTFSKSWTAPASQSGRYLPTIEPSEEQAREDLQVQHDDTATWAVELVNALGRAENLGESSDYSAIGEDINNVMAALLKLRSLITQAAEGQVDDHSLTPRYMSRLSEEGTAAVGTDNIANASITTSKLSAGDNPAVGTDNIQTGAVTSAKLASGTGANAAVAYNNIQTEAVRTDHIFTGAVTHPKLAADAVETDNIKDDAVTDDKLAASGLNISRFTAGILNNARLSNIPATALAGGIPNTKLDTTCVKSVNGNINAVVTHLMQSGTSTVFEEQGTPTLTDYPCRASVSDDQITQNDKVYVEFNAEQINAGIYAPITISYNGGFYVYAEEVPPSPSTVTVDYTIFKKGLQ